MDALKLPRSIGRMRTKLNSMSGFTAAELKTFVTVLSSVLFADVKCLKEEELTMWNHFVDATRHLTKAMVTDEDLVAGQASLLKFAVAMQDMFGYETMKPNLHNAFHILECILDYGPVYVFQLFAMERMNGLLGDYPTNNR